MLNVVIGFVVTVLFSKQMSADELRPTHNGAAWRKVGTRSFRANINFLSPSLLTMIISSVVCVRDLSSVVSALLMNDAFGVDDTSTYDKSLMDSSSWSMGWNSSFFRGWRSLESRSIEACPGEFPDLFPGEVSVEGAELVKDPRSATIFSLRTKG